MTDQKKPDKLKPAKKEDIFKAYAAKQKAQVQLSGEYRAPVVPPTRVSDAATNLAKKNREQYLAKYLDDGEKKKKKKKLTRSLQIIDTDYDWRKERTEVKLMGLDGLVEDLGEDGPVIVNEEDLKLQFRLENNEAHREENDAYQAQYGIIRKHYEDGSGWREVDPNRRQESSDSDDAPPGMRKRMDSDDDAPPGALRKNRLPEDSSPRKPRRPVDDSSPPRKTRLPEDDSSPPRKQRLPEDDSSPKKNEEQSSPPRKRRLSRDSSPPRKKNEEDNSPPRKNRLPEDDSSPPRTKTKDSSPPRKKRVPEDDSSPPRKPRLTDKSSPRKNREHNSPPAKPRVEADVSPPRKTRIPEQDSSPPRKSSSRKRVSSPDSDRKSSSRRKKPEDLDTPLRKSADRGSSPPRKRGEKDSSPPRKKDKSEKGVENEVSLRRRHSERDSSPPRKTSSRTADKTRLKLEDEDLSPPRDKNSSSSSSSSSSSKHKERRKSASDDDLSPRRKIKREESSRSRSRAKKEKDLSPPREKGLKTREQFAVEAKAAEEKKQKSLQALSQVSGAGAATVVRDATGRRLSKEEIEQRKKEAEEKPAPMAWGTGLAQKNAALRQAIDEIEDKSFARSKDDFRMNEMLKAQDRWGDPMAEQVKKSKDLHARKERLKQTVVKEPRPLYRGDPFPNRFGIKPGYRWDGVDRSIGWENKIVIAFVNAEVRSRQGYKWGTADM